LGGHPSVDDEYQQSNLVIVGRVIKAIKVPESDGLLEGTVYTIRIDKTYHGRKRETIKVFSENSSGRFPMNIGDDYVLFLSLPSAGRTMVDACGNSGLVRKSTSLIESVEKLSRR